MTASDTREIVAFAMWKQEALRAAPNVGRKRTAEDFAGASDAERSKWLGLADAAIASIPAVQVAVKPLEWEDRDGVSYLQANCVFGQYQVSWLSEFECWQLYTPKPDSAWRDCFTRHSHKEAAKAAAQADYDARIRSALTPQPSPEQVTAYSENDVEALVEAISPLVAIADAFDANELDDEARKFWGQHSVNTTPHENIVLYSGRGGKEMLTLADCMKARATLARVKGGAA